jgi:hypothetical protein
MRDVRIWVRRPSFFTSVAYAAALVLLVLFCTTFLEGAYKEIASRNFRIRRDPISLLFTFLFGGWLGGWFIVLFVDVESVKIFAPVDYRSFRLLVGFALVAASLLSAIVLSLAF